MTNLEYLFLKRYKNIDHQSKQVILFLTDEEMKKVEDGLRDLPLRENWLLQEHKETSQLTQLEYELISYWKSKGFDTLTKRKDDKRMYIHNTDTKNLYELKGKIFEDLFSRYDTYDFEEILNNCKVI